jgi:hypothetical protein
VAFYRKLQEGYDCVFGSRFSRGGTKPPGARVNVDVIAILLCIRVAKIERNSFYVVPMVKATPKSHVRRPGNRETVNSAPS